jgi:hypothetical protein
MPPDPVSVVSVLTDELVVGLVVVVVVVVELVGGLVVVEVVLVVGVVVDVAGTVVVVVPSSPPPASAMTAMTRPMTSAATRPIATFWPVLMPPSSS